jgi:hypothetical protein
MRTGKSDARNIYMRALPAWLVIAAGMFVNGAVREFTYQPLVGFELGHAISCLTGSAIVFWVAWLFVTRHPWVSISQWIGVGVLWVALTVAFEFGVGHYIGGTSWEILLVDYNLLEGRLWVLVLLSALVAPAYWCRRLPAPATEVILSHV